jgi:endonuclease YncB( thermonuclease family)
MTFEMKMLIKTVSIIITVLVTITSASAFPVDVIRIDEGDVIDTNIQDKHVKIRLYGIDAPENGQHGALAAVRLLRSLIVENAVDVEVIENDVFGRSVAIVKREGKESSINAAMVANGYAWVNPQRCRISVCNYWKDLQRQAKTLRLGIWSGFDLIPPWEFKKEQQR